MVGVLSWVRRSGSENVSITCNFGLGWWRRWGSRVIPASTVSSTGIGTGAANVTHGGEYVVKGKGNLRRERKGRRRGMKRGGRRRRRRRYRKEG